MKGREEERRASNAEHRMKKEQPYDLEERLLDDSAEIIRLTESLPNTRAGNHVAGQMLRSGTSPLANHGEAEAAESTADFIHKLRICLKELRETNRWIKLARRVSMVEASRTDALLQETDELIRIFVASHRTAEKRRS
jgi:four helix bundle protein